MYWPATPTNQGIAAEHSKETCHDLTLMWDMLCHSYHVGHTYRLLRKTRGWRRSGVAGRVVAQLPACLGDFTRLDLLAQTAGKLEIPLHLHEYMDGTGRHRCQC